MAMDQERNNRLFKRAARIVRQVAARPTPDAVHQLRTTVRRLETVFEQLTVVPDRTQKRLLKRLTRLRRRAGRIRDLDVQMAALRTLKIGVDGRRKDALMHDLARDRARREKKLIRALDGDALAELTRLLPRVAAQLPLFPPDTRQEFDPVCQALARFARLARELRQPDAAALHDFRKQCKRVRYLSEMAGADPRAQRVEKSLKQIQDAVGAWHDWHVLALRAERLFAGESAMISALKNVTHAKFSESLRIVTQRKRELLRFRREENAARKQPGRAPSTKTAVASA